MSSKRYVVAISTTFLFATLLAACSNSNDSGSSPTEAATSAAAAPEIAAGDFTADFSVDEAAHRPGVAGNRPGRRAAARHHDLGPLRHLRRAVPDAGVRGRGPVRRPVQDRQRPGQRRARCRPRPRRTSPAGASVLLVDALDSGSGAAIEANADVEGRRGDRLRPPDARAARTTAIYVSFDNVKVGKLIGQGEVDCIAAWKVTKPNILVMDGDPTDNNAKLFAQGYNGVLKPKFDDGTYIKVGEPAGTWTPPIAADDVRAAVHGPPEHQRGRDAERRQRQRGHLGPAEATRSRRRRSRPPVRTRRRRGCRTS